MVTGINKLSILDTPLAIIDFETTGLNPGQDRVVEVAVVRIDPGQRPRLVLDTLIHPDRRVGATDIHGITDDDVASAPKFRQVAGDLLEATRGCVIAAYNVYFDIKFLNFELENLGVVHAPPHVCLMYMRPLLGLGERCKLDVACNEHRIDFKPQHTSAGDAVAAARLYEVYSNEIERQGLRTFEQLAKLRSYKFFSSFSRDPFPTASKFGLPRCERLVSRSNQSLPPDPARDAVHSYWEALKVVLEDLDVSDEELVFMQQERERTGLAFEQVMALHAKAFASVINQVASDKWIEAREARALRRLYRCLTKLGWAPGE